MLLLAKSKDGVEEGEKEHYFHYVRQQNASRVLATYGLCVRPSVCLSVL